MVALILALLGVFLCLALRLFFVATYHLYGMDTKENPPENIPLTLVLKSVKRPSVVKGQVGVKAEDVAEEMYTLLKEILNARLNPTNETMEGNRRRTRKIQEIIDKCDQKDMELCGVRHQGQVISLDALRKTG